MKEVTQYRLPKRAIHVSVLFKRVLVGIVILIATMLFLRTRLDLSVYGLSADRREMQ